MICWENLIGISKTCNKTPSDSGLYVQGLPFIDIKTADAAIGGDTLSGKDLLQQCINNAYDAVSAQLRSYIGNNKRFISNIETFTVGDYESLKATVGADIGKYKGIRLRINLPAYLELTIHSVGLVLTSAITTDIKIFNLLTGKQVGANIPITTIADESVMIEINRSYLTERRQLDLAILYDSGLATAYQTPTDVNSFGDCGCGKSIGSSMNVSAISISQASSIISANLTSLNHTNGMFLKYSLNCSVDSYLCGQGKALAYPIRLKAGAEICKWVKYSKRPSSEVVIHHEDAGELAEDYEVQYQTFIKDYLDNLVVPNDYCFSCDDYIQNRVVIP